MEQPKPTRIDVIEVVREYQTELSKRKRFFDYSDMDRWYLETFEGGYKIPNYICAIFDTKFGSRYFFFQRHEHENFNAMEVRLDLSGISVYNFNGIIWKNYHLLESKIMRCEYLDPDHTKKIIEDRLKAFFTNFTITI